MTLTIQAAHDDGTSPAVHVSTDMIFAFGATTLGQVLVAMTHKGISAILIGSNRDRLLADLRQYFPHAQFVEDHARLTPEIAKVVALIENPAVPQDLSLDLKGSDFEIKVWQALRAIPAGRTQSYSDLAASLGLTGGAKGPAKDVADACAANRIAVAVPCHRILRKDGTISGYRWGVHRKRALLEREGVL